MKNCVQIPLTLALVSACGGSFGCGDREPRDASTSRDTGHVDSGPHRDAQPDDDAGGAGETLRPADRCEEAQLFPAGRYTLEFRDAQDDTQDWGASCSPIRFFDGDLFLRVSVPNQHLLRITSGETDRIFLFESCPDIAASCLPNAPHLGWYNAGPVARELYVGVDFSGIVGLNIIIEPCSGDCAPHVPRCGDGVLERFEQCDDGNNVSEDGCSAICLFDIDVSVCGDGVVEAPNEECDDGNRISGDGCSSSCAPEIPRSELCANAPELHEGVQTVEIGTDDHFSGYRGCDVEFAYGDDAVFRLTIPAGKVAEVRCQGLLSWVIAGDCEPPSPTCLAAALDRSIDYSATGTTTVFVMIEALLGGEEEIVEVLFRDLSCGDGFTDGPESCDDGNLTSGDGCSDSCTQEQGYQCYGDPSDCVFGGDTCNDSALIGEGRYYHGTAGMISNFSLPSMCYAFGLGPDRAYHVLVPPGEEVRAMVLDRLSEQATGGVVLTPSCAEMLSVCVPVDGWLQRQRYLNTSTTTETLYLLTGGHDEYLLDVSIAPPIDHCATAPLIGPGTYPIDTRGLAGVVDGYRGACRVSSVELPALGPEWIARVAIPAGRTLHAQVATTSQSVGEMVAISTDCGDLEGSCAATSWFTPEVQNTGTESIEVVVTVDQSLWRVGGWEGELTVEITP